MPDPHIGGVVVVASVSWFEFWGEKGDESIMSQQQFPTVIVGANPLLRDSLARFLKKSSFNVVALGSCTDELPLASVPQADAILLIIDGCNHPGETCGQIERFRQDYPSGRIVVLANHSTPADIAQVLRSGANGYFATIATCDDFIKSLELVMGGQTVLPSEALLPIMLRNAAGGRNTVSQLKTTPAELFVGSAEVPLFSVRELYILRCLTEGSSNKVIARECEIAEGTVKVHVKAIMRKIKVKNRTQAAIWALNKRNLVWPPTDTPGPTIEIASGAQASDTRPIEASEPVEQDAHIKARTIRRAAGTDVTTSAG